MSEPDPQPILAHLEELRRRLIKVAIAIAVGAGFALIFAQQLTSILERPFEIAAPEYSLIALSPAEEFSILMRVAMFGGIILASPVILYQIWAFINPALTTRERKWAVPLVTVFVVLFVAGVLFGYLLLPRGLEVLIGIFPKVENNLRIGDYYSFVLRLMLAFGVTFQFPVFLFAAAAAGAVTSRQLATGRRWAILVITIVAAIVTPTGDPLTLAALAIPLYLLYELTYWSVRLILRK
ncbi:MAG TPA: twin-arginine translocase subunit TatC [Acidimicrobiia bacterium]